MDRIVLLKHVDITTHNSMDGLKIFPEIHRIYGTYVRCSPATVFNLKLFYSSVKDRFFINGFRIDDIELTQYKTEKGNLRDALIEFFHCDMSLSSAWLPLCDENQLISKKPMNFLIKFDNYDVKLIDWYPGLIIE